MFSQNNAMTETQMILHLRTVLEIACLMLERGQTESVQELLSATLKETNRPIWEERVVYPHVE